ncbi:DUF6232 family protein [Catellatospora bangladeshensis]|uniref:Uncharacterized protein n=1 Tax=Catellatospora bangladeshensis TaxID=310355 RepID=A0A8J3JDV4_9ACTN|nr:DUF6232 family protein [Catellatospora bangladeshensis]GIF78757.1 hypothetical protein Cba03nite_01060 [Catellatospora bangladeshensis]
MPVFYRGPCARITHRVLAVRTPAPRRFALCGLSAVHIVELAPERDGSGATARLYATGTAGAAVVAAWPVLGSTPLAVAATLAAAALAGVGGCWRTRGHSYELHGVYQGSLQVLFRSTDRRTFSQVVRALVRAMEYADDHLTN